MIGGLCLAANPDTAGVSVEQVTYVSSNCLVVHLMLRIIPWYKRHEVPMLCEQLCQ